MALFAPLGVRLSLDVPAFADDRFSDLLVLVVASCIIDGPPQLASLYGCLLTVVANISPYCRRINFLASTKLFDLLQQFAAPSFLYAQEANHRLILLLLDAWAFTSDIATEMHF